MKKANSIINTAIILTIGLIAALILSKIPEAYKTEPETYAKTDIVGETAPEISHESAPISASLTDRTLTETRYKERQLSRDKASSEKYMIPVIDTNTSVFSADTFEPLNTKDDTTEEFADVDIECDSDLPVDELQPEVPDAEPAISSYDEPTVEEETVATEIEPEYAQEDVPNTESWTWWDWWEYWGNLPEEPEHVHNYNIPVYETIHHDPEPIYEEYEIIVCDGCDAEFATFEDYLDHITPIMINLLPHRNWNYRPETRYNEIGETEPWDEQVLIGYECECGDFKAE